MKITRILVSATVISASVLGLGLAGNAFAQTSVTSNENSDKTLVTCGPNNAPRVVDEKAVPLGCRVDQENYRN